jgi:hypothetical protein
MCVCARVCVCLCVCVFVCASVSAYVCMRECALVCVCAYVNLTAFLCVLYVIELYKTYVIQDIHIVR